MPRSAKDNETIRAARREEIFRAAARVFAKKGFAATKIADIAAEAHLSHGLLYHYYGSKEEVYTALFDEILDKRPIMEASVSSAPTAIGRIERRVALWLEKSAERPELGVMVTQALVADTLPVGKREIFLAYARGAYEGLVADIRQAQVDGDATRAAPPEELATAVLSMVRGLATMRFIHTSAFESTPDELGVVSVRTVLRVLAPETARLEEAVPRRKPAPKRRVAAIAPTKTGAKTTRETKKKIRKEQREKSRAA
jgi:AcrR family transcriptional regulator